MLNVREPVTIVRDAFSIPHIEANNPHDLYFALGFVMAQDRLFQMDYLRRQALGRLAEVFGEEQVTSDVLYRTLGIHRIAEREVEQLADEARAVLEAFSAGVNAFIAQGVLPFEFEVLEYEPAAWQPRDSVAALRAFWWYLTGRLYLLAGPEMAKRFLGDEKLYRAFLTPEGDEETIIPRGSYPTVGAGVSARPVPVPVGETIAGPDGVGSNNWVVSGAKSSSGKPLVASDPHLPLGVPSVWYEVHLSGAGFNVAGIALPGTPGVRMGRNQRVVWCATNNICSLRDLYRLPVSDDGKRYEWMGEQRDFKTVVEEMDVKGKASVLHEVRWTHVGPVVNHLLPDAVNADPPIALRWTGLEHADDVQVMLDFERAESVADLRAALRRWKLPTWNFLGADADGHIAYQCVGQIPWRGRWERGFRDANDADDDWRGFVPFEGIPHWVDPERGWIASANNAVVGNDYAHPLFGTWGGDHRARRLRDLLTALEKFSLNDFQTLQMDVHSVRAQELAPLLLNFLSPDANGVIKHLREWDFRFTEDSVGATLFDVWFNRWSHRVARERFPQELDSLLVPQIYGLANALLRGDDARWFGGKDVSQLARQCLVEAIAWLREKMGDDVNQWQWGKLHTLTLQHPLSNRGGLLREVVTIGPLPHHGGYNTINNANVAYGTHETWAGVSYRLTCDLSEPALHGCNCGGQSGQPGSPHYADQLDDWLQGRFHPIPLERERVESIAKATLRLHPS